ncbi:MAG: hypothetical protein NDF54_07635 [archaeon GB-1867-035]|nr:hypothetical protein [Candidatus Culexmicrobium profundum]
MESHRGASSIGANVKLAVIALIALIAGGIVGYIIVQPEIRALREELSETKNELNNIRNELTSTKQQLTETLAELNTTLKQLASTQIELQDAINRITELEENVSEVKGELQEILSRVCRLEILATSPHTANGEDTCQVYVKAYNVKGEPVTDARIAVIALMDKTRDSIRKIYSGFAQSLGDGTYLTQFTSTQAGLIKIYAVDLDSGATASTYVNFLPGSLEDFILSTIFYEDPITNETLISINIFPVDEFGNICKTFNLTVMVNEISVIPYINEYGLPSIVVPYDPAIPTIPITIIDHFTGKAAEKIVKVALNKTKPKHVVKLTVWIVEGSGVTEDKVRQDVKKANEIYKKNADECDFSKVIVFEIKEFKKISKDKWKDIAGADGRLDVGEGDERNKLPDDKDNSTIDVYYVPGIDYNEKDPKTGATTTSRVLGVSWEGDKPGIAIDNSADFDDRTLAHELAHQLSDGEVVDQGASGAADQGANKAGNLMNYDNTGDDLTKKQAQLIEEKLGDP